MSVRGWACLFIVDWHKTLLGNTMDASKVSCCIVPGTTWPKFIACGLVSTTVPYNNIKSIAREIEARKGHRRGSSQHCSPVKIHRSTCNLHSSDVKTQQESMTAEGMKTVHFTVGRNGLHTSTRCGFK